MSLRSRVHSLLDGEPLSAAATALRTALATLIVVNVAAVVLETVPSLARDFGPWFGSLESFSLLVFGAEYALRAWSAPEHASFRGPVRGRLRWALTPGALIDLVALLPAVLPAGGDLRALRLARLLRILRVAKLGRYSLAVQTLQHVLRAKAPDLGSLLVLLLVLLVLSSTAMYHLEHDAQPEGFASIPATMWWGIVTLTTIGYGDLAPVTGGGRVLGGVIAILGIGMFALPAGLLGAAFVDELGRARHRRSGVDPADGAAQPTCPHCGQRLGGT